MRPLPTISNETGKSDRIGFRSRDVNALTTEELQQIPTVSKAARKVLAQPWKYSKKSFLKAHREMQAVRRQLRAARDSKLLRDSLEHQLD